MTKLPIVIDIETKGQPWDEDGLICIGWSAVSSERPFPNSGMSAETEGVVLGSKFGKDHPLARALADPEQPIVEHTKYDVRWLRLAGFEVRGDVYDTQVMAWLLNENTPLDLDYLTQRYCGITMDKRITTVGNKPMFRTDKGPLVPLAEAPWEQMRAYNLRDVRATEDLFVTLLDALTDRCWDDFWREEEVPFTEVLVGMEVAGLPLDTERGEELRAQFEAEAETLRQHLLDTAGLPSDFNLGSGDQLAAFLFGKVLTVKARLPITPRERECYRIYTGYYNDTCARIKQHEKDEDCGLPCWEPPEGFEVERAGTKYVEGTYRVPGRGLRAAGKTETGKRPKVDSRTLLVHYGSDPWVMDLIRWRKLTKALTTYLRAFPKFTHGGRLYGRFNQTGTVTGRLSSSEPNLQNIPAHGDLGIAIRSLFSGELVVGDYSQLEPRLMAHFSGDPVLTDAYRSGADVYIVTAEGIFGRKVGHDDPERQIAKTLVLALGYGAGPFKLAEILSINGYPTDVGTARAYLDELSDLYQQLFRWKEAVVGYAHDKGYVKTLSGRLRRLRTPLGDANYKTVGYGERQAVNAIIQGSAADVVRRVMVRTSGISGLTLLAQVHDELLWECWEDEWWSVEGGGEAGFLFTLREIRDLAEQGHGFALDVPLVFEPSRCSSWAEKGSGGLLLPEDFEEAA